MNKKRITASLLALMTLALPLTACGSRNDPMEQPKDDTKSQLYVGCWNGDFGTEWLSAIAKRFEQQYADHSFETGKKGVQVWVTGGSTYVYEFSDDLKNATDDIAIGEQGSYYGFVNKGSALDITDAVTTPLTEYGETKSIEDKFMSAEDVTYYGSLATKSEKAYYGLPWYESFMGFQYDLDYFEENNLYFAADGMGSNGFVTNKNMPKSNGPDGVEGTEDDGLPATYDDFFKLLDKIYDLGDEPVAWAGNAQVYLNNLLSSLAADYEGYDQMNIHYSLDGSFQYVVDKINADGTFSVRTETIDQSNGYLMKQSAGLYSGLQFLERLITTKENGKNKYFNITHCTTTSYNHRFAQRKFLEGGFVEGAPRVGLLIDGSWWYSGASTIFNEMSSLPGASATERKIGFMPLPKADASRLGEATYINNWPTSIHIKSTIESSKIDMAKQFVRFMHTDESLSEFTMITGGSRPYRYDIQESHEANVSHYGKEIMRLHNTAKIVNPWSTTPLVLDNLNAFMLNDSIYNTVAGGKSYKNVSTAFLAGVSAKAYFEGLDYNNKNAWDLAYSKYYNN